MGLSLLVLQPLNLSMQLGNPRELNVLLGFKALDERRDALNLLAELL